MTPRTQSQIALVATLIIALSIGILTLSAPASLPRVGGGDKLHHALAFAVLVYPMALARPEKWRLIGIVALSYGGLIELVQPSVGRTAEWADWIADALGVLTGILSARLSRQLLTRYLFLRRA